MRGIVVTFYSYKGGVGRSFALANIAALLGRWGFRVLCVDWDLEAPGLEDFFRPYRRDDRYWQSDGLVELLLDFHKRAQVPLLWRDFVLGLDSNYLPGVDLIKAGRADDQYTRRLQQLNWDRLYKKGLGDALETMFDEVRENYDFVLIDSRTGVTDFSGIVTAQLPDILAFLFTANEQSVGGATRVAKRASTIRNDIALDRSPLLTLPIPARFESQVEHRISQKWREHFVAQLGEFYSGWVSQDVALDKLIPATTIPYIPFWSFGEKLSVIEDPIFDQSSINFAMENLAALLAHKLSRTQLLVGSRDEFVGAARRIGRDPDKSSVFISYSMEHRPIALKLKSDLVRHGIDVRSFEHLKVGEEWTQSVSEALERVDHFVLLFGQGDHRNRAMESEVRAFLRQSASDERPRLLIPFRVGSVERLPSFIQHLRFYDLADDVTDATVQILELLRPIEAIAPVEAISVHVRVSGDGNRPLAGGAVSAIADNGTTLDAVTDNEGRAHLRIVTTRPYRILIAHPHHRPKIIENFKVSEEMNIRLERRGEVGSIIIHSTGYIDGLSGQLNPILDTNDRTYLYASNIAIDGGKRQPVTFSVDEPFILEDAHGHVFRAIVRFIEGRTSLVEYEKVASRLEKLVVLRNEIDRTIRKLADRARESNLDPKIRDKKLSSRQLAEYVVLSNPDTSTAYVTLQEFWAIANPVLHGQSLTATAVSDALQLGDEALRILGRAWLPKTVS